VHQSWQCCIRKPAESSAQDSSNIAGMLRQNQNPYRAASGKTTCGVEGCGGWQGKGNKWSLRVVTTRRITMSMKLPPEHAICVCAAAGCGAPRA
jgi:hypothetical protein